MTSSLGGRGGKERRSNHLKGLCRHKFASWRIWERKGVRNEKSKEKTKEKKG